VIAAYLDAFQKIADSATNAKGKITKTVASLHFLLDGVQQPTTEFL